MCFRKKDNVKTKDKIKKFELENQNDIALYEIASNLINGHPIILSISKIPADYANKVLAFLSGVSFSLRGQTKEIRHNLYLFTREDSYADGTLTDALGSY